MMHPLLSALLFTSSALVTDAASTYKLDTTYTGDSIFNQFDFFTGSDPTHGFVKYLDQNTATSKGLVSVVNGVARWGVDHNTVLSPSGPGRNSVRISSKKSWTHGLFIADVAHMPGSICGMWPAFWTLGFGKTWPLNGEIDIIEGVNSQQTNLMSAHTSPNCLISGTNQLGTLQANDCDTAANSNAGCATSSSNSKSYGTPFNSNGGGVYAMEWTSAHIRIWFWERNAIPANLNSNSPDPSEWGLPQANFQGSCNIDGHFNNHQIVFDTTFCGDWAGNAEIWAKDATCKTKAASCVAYVAEHPGDFAEAYWAVNSIKVYQLQPSNGPVQGDASTVTQTVALVNAPLAHDPKTSKKAAGILPSPTPSGTAHGPALPGAPVDPKLVLTDIHGLPGNPHPTSPAESLIPDLQAVNHGLALPPVDIAITSIDRIQDINGGADTGDTSGSDFMVLADYLPQPTTTQMPANEILGFPRGGCGCGEDPGWEDETSHTTSTTTSTVYVDVHVEKESCTEKGVLRYGSMATATGAPASNVNEVVVTPTKTYGQASSTTGYLQVSNAAAVPVDAKLGALGVGVGMLCLVGVILQ